MCERPQGENQGCESTFLAIISNPKEAEAGWDGWRSEWWGDGRTSAMKSEREQYPLGMLGQHWFGCESNEHNINSSNKCLLSDFYIHGTILGSWDPPVKKKPQKTNKRKPKTSLILWSFYPSRRFRPETINIKKTL